MIDVHCWGSEQAASKVRLGTIFALGVAVFSSSQTGPYGDGWVVSGSQLPFLGYSHEYTDPC